jgi:myo-inositol 2-dehydrogenase/D-chiro-inositol 1-dehydrogenase
MATVPYSGPMQITGTQAWAWQDPDAPVPAAGSGMGKFAANGAFSDNLAFADRDKERTFIDSITSGNSHNQIAAGVETALSCMLGRMAGLTRRETTWEDLLAHGETYQLGFTIDQFA